MFDNKIWSIVSTSLTATPLYYDFKFKVYRVQLVFKYYDPVYKITSEPLLESPAHLWLLSVTMRHIQQKLN
jgi:hypothetical protein